jgi:uncharacterized protein YjbI with pentapeptide repeats
MMAEGKGKPTLKQRQSSQDRAPQSKPWTLKEFSGKTVWDWLQFLSALAIPVVLAVAGFTIESQLAERQRLFENKLTQQAQDLEDQRAQQAQELEDQRAEAERELAEQRAQDEALQAYLNQMNELLLEKDLRASDSDSEVRSLARARTITVLGRLDPSRKTAVMQFLVEAGLVQRVNDRGPIIGLRSADLSGVDLSWGADLGEADLSEADLSKANLSLASLHKAQLWAADLSHATLGAADLSKANLQSANLTHADLSSRAGLAAFPEGQADGMMGANLTEAFLGSANLSSANLSGAFLYKATLGGANLSDTNLSGTMLAEAYVNNTKLGGADLTNANLSGADLSDAREITDEQLEQQVKSLKGATMPDRSKHP